MMNADQKLFILYLTAAIINLCSLISFTIVWLYWQKTLNTCHIYELDLSEQNCGCILYGKWGVEYFRGGNISFCQFVGLSPIPVAIWSGVIALYHGYRAHCSFKKPKVTLISKEEVKVVNPRVWRRPIILLTFAMALIMSVITFSSGVVLTDGYIKTCTEYRKSIIKGVSASGNLAKLVFDRISCGTVIDFIDYLQPDPDFLELKYRRGDWILQSDVSLKITLFCTWCSLIIYFIISLITFQCVNINRQKTVLNTDL